MVKLEVTKDVIDYLSDKARADGCSGCAFIDVEEWEMPCCRCARGCKDFWRNGVRDGK